MNFLSLLFVKLIAENLLFLFVKVGHGGTEVAAIYYWSEKINIFCVELLVLKGLVHDLISRLNRYWVAVKFSVR